MKQRLDIIKVGGKVLDDTLGRGELIRHIAGHLHPHLLVHGGGNIASQLMEKMSILPQFVDGRRITDEKSLEIAVMVYAGLLNKQIVSTYNSHHGANVACGLSGADMNVIVSTKRPPQPIDFGYVGDVTTSSVNVGAIELLLKARITPIFCAITADKQGNLLNTNADSIASCLAMALVEVFEVHLIFLFEQNGVLQNFDDKHSVIKHIHREQYAQLKKDGIVSGGMIPKLDSAFSAIERGVSRVIIGHYKDIAHIESTATTITA